MEVGSVQVPGSRPFQFGTLITLGIVVVAGAVAALPIPILSGFVVLFGWGIGFLAGVAGAIYAVRSANLGSDASGDGAKLGAVVGAVGNALGAVVAIVFALIAGLIGSGARDIPSQTPPGAPEIGTGSIIVALLIIGGIGFVTGTIMAVLGGAIGGYLATRL